MEHQGQHQHGHATSGAGGEGYGNPVAGHPHGQDTTVMAGHGEADAGAGGQFHPAAAEEHRSRGILHRSGSSSSSSSSEDDGMGGRRKKKGLKEKIKEKLPGGHKDNQQNPTGGGAYGQQAHAGMTDGAGTHGTDGTAGGHGEKKGLMDKIKEKLPGHH